MPPESIDSHDSDTQVAIAHATNVQDNVRNVGTPGQRHALRAPFWGRRRVAQGSLYIARGCDRAGPSVQLALSRPDETCKVAV